MHFYPETKTFRMSQKNGSLTCILTTYILEIRLHALEKHALWKQLYSTI